MEVLFWQEMTSYRTTDYLGAFRKGIEGRADEGIAASNAPATKTCTAFGIENDATSSGERITEHWRDIICEWAYNCKYLVEN